jgi:hypothetical protein
MKFVSNSGNFQINQDRQQKYLSNRKKTGNRFVFKDKVEQIEFLFLNDYLNR